MSEAVTADVVREMQTYYARRAATYERVYRKPERQSDLRAIEAWLAAPDGPFAGRHGLEIACGTGWWTPHAARHARSWLATDLNDETLVLARAKPLPACVRFALMDAYTLAGLPEAGAEVGVPAFDGALAGFWWSHVPLARLPGWLDRLHGQLAPGARVVFLDNAFVPGSSTPLSRRDAEGNTYQQRGLDDGSTHEVLKNFPTPDEAIAQLGARARTPEWRAFEHYWTLSYTLA